MTGWAPGTLLGAWQEHENELRNREYREKQKTWERRRQEQIESRLADGPPQFILYAATRDGEYSHYGIPYATREQAEEDAQSLRDAATAYRAWWNATDEEGERDWWDSPPSEWSPHHNNDYLIEEVSTIVPEQVLVFQRVSA